jgi:hypothetical protein
MAGTLGNLRGVAKCLLCNREHEPLSVSFGIYGGVSICPGHPVRLKKAIRAGGAPRMIADEIIGRAQGK